MCVPQTGGTMAQVIKRGERRYLVRVFLGRDRDGKRRFHNKTFRGTKKEAEGYARDVQAQVDAGTWTGEVDPGGQTVEAFMDYWLDHTAARRVSPFTLDDYRGLARRYIHPTLGKIPLRDLAPSDVQRLVTRMEAKGLSPRTIRRGQGLLRNALNKAVREGTIPTNPASSKMVDLPKRETRELSVLSAEEARAFIEAAREDEFAPLWILLLTSGMRPGEALGLKWEDFDGAGVRVQRALVRDRRGGGWELRPPKTKKSRRTIPLPPVAVQALRDHRKAQAAAKLAAEDYAGHGLIFADGAGEPLVWAEVARKHFKDILTQADLPPIRAYDLRHTCASLLLASGVNPKVVSERLGHSTIVLTMDTYSAVLPGLQEEATAKLGEMLG